MGGGEREPAVQLPQLISVYKYLPYKLKPSKKVRSQFSEHNFLQTNLGNCSFVTQLRIIKCSSASPIQIQFPEFLGRSCDSRNHFSGRQEERLLARGLAACHFVKQSFPLSIRC